MVSYVLIFTIIDTDTKSFLRMLPHTIHITIGVESTSMLKTSLYQYVYSHKYSGIVFDWLNTQWNHYYVHTDISPY